MHNEILVACDYPDEARKVDTAACPAALNEKFREE
jgi:hypothetical protein